MAIDKIYSPCLGSKGRHWKIVQANYNVVLGEVQCVIALYKDKKAAEKQPDKFIMSLAGSFKAPKSLLIKGNLLKFLYDELKKNTKLEGSEEPFFAGAKEN